MIVNVIDLLRPLRKAEKTKNEAAIAALAARIATGDDVSPQELGAALDRMNATDEELQTEITRQGRIIELKETIHTGKGARRRLEAITQEFDRANKAVSDAEERRDEVYAKHEGEWRAMKKAVAEAADAANELLRPEYLTDEQKQTIADSEKAMNDAAAVGEEAKSVMPALRDLIADAEADWQRLAAESAPQGRIADAERIVVARRERLAKAEQAVAQAQQEIEEARKRRDAVYDAIRRAAGA